MKKYNKILLVDDDEHINFYNKIMLNKVDAANEIIEFESASKALDFLKDDTDVDLILLDINMPKINGWTFVEEFQKFSDSKQSVEIIMLSSSINHDDKKKAQSEKLIKKFVNKPLTKDTIQEILE